MSHQVSIKYTTFFQPNNFFLKYSSSGSSQWTTIDGKLTRKPRVANAGTGQLKRNVKYVRGGMNRAKVQGKVIALSRLERSRKFMAFITISFPAGLKDEHGYQALNTVLTRMRTTNGLKDYIWVAERQKNGTIHFHMIVNQFFNISIVNHYFRQAIRNILRENGDSSIKFQAGKYNGVDVQKIYSPGMLKGYVTKYVTKATNDDLPTRWNCSSSVSRLFTRTVMDVNLELAIKNFANYLCTVDCGHATVWHTFHGNVFTYDHPPPRSWFSRLDGLNKRLEFSGLLN